LKRYLEKDLRKLTPAKRFSTPTPTAKFIQREIGEAAGAGPLHANKKSGRERPDSTTKIVA